MKAIAEAIQKVMEEINGVAKNMTVGSGNNTYKWVADKDVKQAIRESMIKNWLSILPIWGTPKIQIDRWEEMDNYTKAMKTKQSCFTEIETRYLLLHTSGESIEVYGYGQWVDTQDKGAGKATTYALKNTLLNMFLIPTGVDTDNTHSDDIPVPKNIPQEKRWPTNSDLLLEALKNAPTIEELLERGKQIDTVCVSDKQKEFFKNTANKRYKELNTGDGEDLSKQNF